MNNNFEHLKHRSSAFVPILGGRKSTEAHSFTQHTSAKYGVQKKVIAKMTAQPKEKVGPPQLKLTNPNTNVFDWSLFPNENENHYNNLISVPKMTGKLGQQQNQKQFLDGLFGTKYTPNSNMIINATLAKNGQQKPLVFNPDQLGIKRFKIDSDLEFKNAIQSQTTFEQILWDTQDKIQSRTLQSTVLAPQVKEKAKMLESPVKDVVMPKKKESDTEVDEKPSYDDKYKKKKSKMHSDDFDLNVGKVIDTLKNDYPVLFQQPPDFSIYIDQIEINDPTGKTFHGMKAYKSLWQLLRWSNKTAFKETELKFTIHYCHYDQAVRVIWHCKIWSDLPIFESPLHVDGISKYFVNWEGMVYKHEVSNIMVNGIEQEAPYIKFLDFAWVNQKVPGVAVPNYPGIPTCISTDAKLE